jgi:hypothetical protein
MATRVSEASVAASGQWIDDAGTTVLVLTVL